MRKLFIVVLCAAAVTSFINTNHKSSAFPDDVLEKASVLPVRAVRASEAKNLTRENFDMVIEGLYEKIGLASYNLSYDVFRMGMIGYYGLKSERELSGKDILTIIDFGKPSTEKRFYTIDLKNHRVKYHTYVAHGRNTGQNRATSFSNTPHSNQSSLGFFVTGETYVGSKGYSLRLDGKEGAFNDKVRSRAVVIHAADYVTEAWIQRYGRLGRSQGCPALPPHLNREIIDTIKGKSAIFTYYPDVSYLAKSNYLKTEDLFAKLDKSPLALPLNTQL